MWLTAKRHDQRQWPSLFCSPQLEFILQCHICDPQEQEANLFMARRGHIMPNLIPCQRWVADVDLIRLGSLSEALGYPSLISPTHNTTPACECLQKTPNSSFNTWALLTTDIFAKHKTRCRFSIQSWHWQEKSQHISVVRMGVKCRPYVILSRSHNHAMEIISEIFCCCFG